MSTSRSVLGAGYFWYFAATGIFLPFWPVFLRGKGFGATEIGLFMAIFYAVRTVGGPVYASLADVTGRRVALLRFASLGAATCAVAFHFATDAWAIAVALGCYFSVNGEMLRSPKHRQLVAGLPADRLLTETDGPFVEVEGRSMRPRDVAQTVAELAVLRGGSVEAMEGAILDNLRTLLNEARP